MPYLGFGSISGAIHLIARLGSLSRALLIAGVLILACREMGFAEGPSLSAITLSSPQVTQGSTLQGAVTLNAPAPFDVEVSLAADPATGAIVPAKVTVPAGSTTATFEISAISGKNAGIGSETLVTIYGNYTVTRNASFTSVPSLSLDNIVDRIVDREQENVAALKRLHPLTETYIQSFKSEKDGRVRPESDQYFLSRLEIGDKPDVALFRRNDSSLGLHLMNPFSTALARKYLPAGFAQMTMLDADFKKNTYSFNFVRREFLGELRCIVLDVQPRAEGAKGRFTGRIWVEDRDFNIVRFNGTYTANSRYRYYLHFDSWRVNLQPGLWLPIYIYSEESDTRRSSPPFRSLNLKAQTRFWGYNIDALNQHTEFTQIQVDSAQDTSAGMEDLTPVEAERAWERQAEENALDHLQKVGLVAVPGDVDKVLQTVVNNLIVTNNLSISPDVRCRVLLTTPLESFTIGHTIVLSRGLIDVLPDEASLAMVLAHELGHISLGHRINTKLAFTDRFFFPDINTLERLDFERKPADEEAADQRAIELLGRSPYRDKLDSAGLFLKALQDRAPQLTSLIRPHLGNGLGDAKSIHMAPLTHSAPALQTQSLDQVAALPLGSRIKVDPWSNEIQITNPKPLALLSAEEKMPFEVTPFLPYMTRFSSAPVQMVSAK